MERSLGAEIATMFGARLRYLYTQDSQNLPIRIAACLDRLKQAEDKLVACDRKDSGEGQSPALTR